MGIEFVLVTHRLEIARTFPKKKNRRVYLYMYINIPGMLGCITSRWFNFSIFVSHNKIAFLKSQTNEQTFSTSFLTQTIKRSFSSGNSTCKILYIVAASDESYY